LAPLFKALGVGTNIVLPTTKLTVKVIPGASQDQVVGWLGAALKVRVRAQPEKGKANTAVVALLADFLSTPAGNIDVCYGQTSRNKVIEIRGISDAEIRKKISALAT